MIAYVTRFNPYIFPRPLFLKTAVNELQIYMLGRTIPLPLQSGWVLASDRPRLDIKLFELAKRTDLTKYIDSCVRQGEIYDGLSLLLESYYTIFFRRLDTRNVVIKNLIGALGALRAGKRVVVDLMDYWHCNKPYVVFNSLDFYILRRARCVIAWSKAIAGFMRRYLGRRCVAYLPFGVNLALADPLKVGNIFFERFPELSSYVIVGYSGGGEPYHGIDTLMYAFSLLERRRRDVFLVVQTWGGSDRILMLIKRLGLKRVAVLPPAPVFNDPLRLSFLRASSVLVNTASKVPGIYLAERTTTYWYMSAGRPIVAEATPGVRGVLKHGLSALFVPLGDVKSLAKAIEEVIDDSSFARRLGDNARRLAEEEYNWGGKLGRRARVLFSSLFE